MADAVEYNPKRGRRILFQPHDSGYLTGLVNRPELNGVRGRVVRHIPGKDRWEVKLNDGHGKATAKAENLWVVM